MQEKLMEEARAELIEKINELLNSSECDKYLYGHMVKYLNIVNIAGSLYQINMANNLLQRYCLDSMDWDSDNFKHCQEIQVLSKILGQRIESSLNKK